MKLEQLQDQKAIVVINGGNVIVGDCRMTDTGAFIIEDAHVVRVWGTTNGLGEIALHGPTKKTVLDYCGYVEVNESQVLFVMRCVPESWTKKK